MILIFENEEFINEHITFCENSDYIDRVPSKNLKQY